MYAFRFILVCCYATNIAMCVVLRDFPSTRKTLPEASTESLTVKCAKFGSNFEKIDTDPELSIDRQGSLNFQLENENSLDSFPISDDSVKVPDKLLVHYFAQSGFEQTDFENTEDALRGTISDLLPTVGFEFLIASETLKKATVLEELASSITPFEDISDEDDFKAFLIAEDDDCEEIHNFEFKDSESKNDSMPFISTGNDSIQVFSNFETNQSLPTDFVFLIPDSSMENFQDNSEFENVQTDIMHSSISNMSSSEIEAINVNTDFVLLIPGGSIENFGGNSNVLKDTNESGIDSSFANISSSENKDTNLELESNLLTIQDIFSAPLKETEMTTAITKNLTESVPDMSTSNEGLLVEMSEGTQTSSNNLTSSETLVTDSNSTISELLVTDSDVPIAEEKKCPPGGFCLFSFVFRDTCNKHSDCRGDRLCCKSGCSKKCLDL